ncbi:MAG: DUF262 domain-containing protein [Anaerobiospirillum succiniciproducens]|uniref:DUF262 domain-containing protein n=1 Tax=Anaerobiospirillum succiniciproducens TaxID=13335 RepID=UPI0026DBA4C6|nr:DUF262 domain-containing protein [Anaerobiospirillum succiniciproducens]MDO4676802.1 DUF262 domain-containing protein [Anaerobiospirillum succiniciproducens]
MSSLEPSAQRTPSVIPVRRLATSFDITNIGQVISYMTNNCIEYEYLSKCRGDKWSNAKQSAFIESLILGFPIPPFYLNVRTPGCFSVIDGYQRLNSLKRFIVDNAYALSNLELAHEFEGKYYSELPNPIKRRILETTVIVHKITEVNNPEVMNSYYRRLSLGNSNHTQLEVAFSYATPNTWDFLEEFVPHINQLFERKLSGLEPYEKAVKFFDLLIHEKELNQADNHAHQQDISATLPRFNDLNF